MTYQVQLEAFEGPFDLLLQLIARRQVDVTEIDLGDITADFLAHLGEQLEDLDLESATRFLVVAATLVEIKASRLLPDEKPDEFDDLLGEARDLLYARLLEYRAYRDVSRLFRHRLNRYADRLPRDVPPEPWLLRLVPATPLPIDVGGLAALAAVATAPRPEPEVDLTHIRRSYVSIRDAALEILGALPGPGERTAFPAITEGRERGDRVVFFLALLELFKLGQIDLDQPDPRSAIGIQRRAGGQDLDTLQDEDEPSAAPGDSSDDEADRT